MSVKSTLKKIRESIDNKEFDGALKLSKNVLKEEPDNYMALVYSGLASQELCKYEDAEKFYLKAIAHNPTNTLAIHGLANLYDKWIEAEDVDLPKAQKSLKLYNELINLESDSNKCMKVLSKMGHAAIVKIAADDVIQTLSNLQSLEKLDQTCKQIILQMLLHIISNLNRIPAKYHELYEQCYLAANSKELLKQHHLSYLKVLLSKCDYGGLVQRYNSLHEYKFDPEFLDWFCEIFLQLHIKQNSNSQLIASELKELNLTSLENPSKSVMLSEVILTMDSIISEEVKDAVENVTQMNPNFLYAWLILTQIYIQLQFKEEAINAVLQAEKISKSSTDKHIQEQLTVLLCAALCKSKNQDHLQRVLQLGEQVSSKSSDDLVAHLIEANLRLKNFNATKELLDKLNKTSYHYVIAKAHLLKTLQKLQEAIQLLEEQTFDSMDYWLLLGDCYWCYDKTKSLIMYLKATKANPNSFICFQRLGLYYNHVGDLDKARRCFEKSIKIKVTKAAGVSLSKIYRKLNRKNENLTLLLMLTEGNITIDNSWAFFQLGIQYYEEENFLEATNTLRLVTRIDPTNSFSWESLADCYFSTGSYTAALKCYQKVLSLDSNSLYAKLQVAHLKKLIGEFQDAIVEFERLLYDNRQYIPALKGVAETYFLLAKQHYNSQLYGLARDCFQESLNYVARALHINANLICCWKIAGDCCYLVSKLPMKDSMLIVTEIFSEVELGPDDHALIAEELVKLAIKIYCKALSYNQDNITIYHDLACCYIEYSESVNDASERSLLLEHALRIIKHCIRENPTYAPFWNVLGSIFFQLGARNLDLAQHAFIQAISLDRNSAISWTNLGMLYLHLNELKLANEVFSHAQKSNPNYVGSWIGQALIAEAADMEESMDLFRHTMELAYHPEGTIGYANWVCKTLMHRRRGEVIYAIDNMHAIPVAHDGLRWYVENNRRDACAWNMLGILNEHLGLNESAINAYRNAAKFSRDDPRAVTNLGRALVTSGFYSKAIHCYEEMKERSLNAEIAYALALFKDEAYEHAYEVYAGVLKDFSGKKEIQSDLLVALASMVYMFQGPDQAKHLLFQSTELESRSPWSLYAVLSLGLLEEDVDLAKLAFDEIEKLPVNEENLKHYAKLLVYTFLVQGEYNTSISKLSSLIHKYPNSPSLWLELAVLLYRLRNVNAKYNAIDKCAKSCLILKGSNPHLTQVLPIITATAILRRDKRNALKSAQQLVHCYPDNSIANETLKFTRTHLV